MKAGRKGERETQIERTHAWGERGRGRKGRRKRQGGHAYAWRVHTGEVRGVGRGRLALENVKPTDSPIYRPPSEFAVRAFRKTSAATRGSPTGTSASVEIGRKPRARARCRGVFRFPCMRERVSERTNERSDAAFLPFLLALPRPWRFSSAGRRRDERKGGDEGRGKKPPNE